MDVLKKTTIITQDRFLDILDHMSVDRDPDDLARFDPEQGLETADDEYLRDNLAEKCGLDNDGIGYLRRLGHAKDTRESLVKIADAAIRVANATAGKGKSSGNQKAKGTTSALKDKIATEGASTSGGQKRKAAPDNADVST